MIIFMFPAPPLLVHAVHSVYFVNSVYISYLHYALFSQFCQQKNYFSPWHGGPIRPFGPPEGFFE
jgi:hypothetical protein